MSVPEQLKKLVGTWSGTSQLWKIWPSPESSNSESRAVIALEANAKFLSIRYTWSVDGQSHEGLLVLGREDVTGEAQCAWIDSWHMSEAFMLSKGSIREEGSAAVVGSYAAPPGPDWHWRTEIHPAENAFELVMYNISPEQEETLAYRNRYERERRPSPN